MRRCTCGASHRSGPPRELRSPDAAYTIVWWEPDAATSSHTLLLKAAYTPKTWRVYSFARSVNVSWAPTGHLYAVTDRLGSDGATTVLRNVTTSKQVEVCAIARQSLGSRWATAHHRYCDQAGGTNRGELLLRLWGYGDGGAFDTRLTVPVRRIKW